AWLTRVTVNACRDRRRAGWWMLPALERSHRGSPDRRGGAQPRGRGDRRGDSAADLAGLSGTPRSPAGGVRAPVHRAMLYRRGGRGSRAESRKRQASPLPRHPADAPGARRRAMSRCLSDEALMRVVAELATPAERAHLAACPACGARRSRLEGELDGIRQVLVTTAEPRRLAAPSRRW